MSNHKVPESAIWALLIGVDCYMDRTIGGLPDYPHLRGCVNDVTLMEAFLLERLHVPSTQIIKLTASGPGAKPEEPEQKWPTKANIVAAFRDLAKRAKKGDQVHIHYSGHGGRALTIFPELKGDEALDESLVPTDYGQIENPDQPEDRYVRDVELALLLQALVDWGLIVTVVIDCCHSGGAARGEDDVAVRGIPEPDLVQRVPSSLVAGPRALMDSWQAQTRGTRGSSVGSGWLPDPEGYTLLAACRALELAQEYQAPNGQRHGALSYWLWHALQHPAANWQAVGQQVVASVHGSFASQTPQLQGVGARPVFGGASLALPVGISVLEVDGNRLRLNVGQAAGVGVGARFYVYRQGVTDFRQTDQRVAVIELSETEGAESWGDVVRRLDEDAVLEPGAQAVMFDPGYGQQRVVRLVRTGDALPGVEAAALKGLEEAIKASESRFVRPAGDGERASFQVAVTAAQGFEVRDASGQPLPNLRPVSVDQPAELADRLTHLAKYFNVLEMASPDSMSRLAGKLEVTLMRTPETPFDEPGGIPTVKHAPADSEPGPDQIFYLRIRNLFEPPEGPPTDARWYIEQRRQRTMNITVLNLSAEYAISRFVPYPGDAEPYYDLEPGDTLRLPRVVLPGQAQKLPSVVCELPDGIEEGFEVFKVFATTETTGYDSLLLPPVADMSRGAKHAKPTSPVPELSWIATQAMVHVVR